MRTLFALNPLLDVPAIAHALKTHGRVQVRQFLHPEAADSIHDVLARGTDWGLAWAAAGKAGAHVRGAQLRAMPPEERARFGTEAAEAAKKGKFAFLYAQYPMVKAYLEKWDPGHPLDLLLEHLNTPPMLDFARAVSGIPEIRSVDAQATLYAPGHFLTLHNDEVEGEGRRIAFIISLARDWLPDWGGHLNFVADDGDTVEGFVPRFNALNLFTVPNRHNVGTVAPFAPVGRFSITGWFRDK